MLTHLRHFYKQAALKISANFANLCLKLYVCPSLLRTQNNLSHFCSFRGRSQSIVRLQISAHHRPRLAIWSVQILCPKSRNWIKMPRDRDWGGDWAGARGWSGHMMVCCLSQWRLFHPIWSRLSLCHLNPVPMSIYSGTNDPLCLYCLWKNMEHVPYYLISYKLSYVEGSLS